MKLYREYRRPSDMPDALPLFPLDGALLLGRGLDLDLSVHLALRPETLARRTPAHEAWMLPAYARYDAEVEPDQTADVVLRVDDARHPAVVVRR